MENNNNNSNPGNAADKKAIIRELLEQGKEKGSLLRSDIVEELEKHEFTADQINVIIDEFRNSGVEIEESFSIDDLTTLKA